MLTQPFYQFSLPNVGGEVLCVPVRDKRTDELFYFQLDTGCPKSFLYANSLPNHWPSIAAESATLNKTLLPIETDINLPDQFTLLFNQPPSSLPIIGTLGLDCLHHRFLALDFKNKLYSTERFKPPQQPLLNCSLIQFNKLYGIQLQLWKQTFNFILDTGTSGFNIVFRSSVLENQIDLAVELLGTTDVPAWDKTVEVSHFELQDAIELLPNFQIDTISSLNFNQMNPKEETFLEQYQIAGIIGNLCWQNHLITIDYNRQEFKVYEVVGDQVPISTKH